MKTTILPLLTLLASFSLAACRSAEVDGEGRPANGDRGPSAAQPGFEYAVLSFSSVDATLAANLARREFSVPPMEQAVQVMVDPRSNAWIASATAADLVRVRQIAARIDAATAEPDQGNAQSQSSDVEPSAEQVARWLANRKAEVILFEHQDAALAANSARQHLVSPEVEEQVILLVDRDTNAWIVLADPVDRAHVRTLAARYDGLDGPAPRAR